MNTFWRRLFTPEALFTVSTAAALSPYLLWRFGFKAPMVDRLELTYIPVLVWACGLTAFLAGARLARKTSERDITFRLCKQNLPVNLLLSFGVAIALVQVYFAIQDVYGVLPLFDYLSSDGRIDVGFANDLQQYSASGQLGMLTTSLYALNALFLIAIIQRVTWRRGSRIALGFMFLSTAFAHLINAKRGGVYSMLVYLIIGVSIYFGEPVAALSALVPRRSRIFTKGALLLLAALLLFAFGYFASIRTRGRDDAGIGEIIAYLQYPLINLETQCKAAGLGPGEFKLLGPLRYLAPYKSAEVSDTLFVTTPRFVRDSPSGLYEYIHWCWGLPGVIAFSLVLGFVSRWFYDRALTSLRCLLSYCYLAVSLTLAHTSNQFLILAYVPVPLIFGSLLKLLVSTEQIRLLRVPARQPAADFDNSLALEDK
jgi:oligosaccharide repeat unit polymerase